MNDAARLSRDPTFRLIGSEKIWERGAALTSRLQSFETELLTQDENLAGLAAINRDLIARAEAMDSRQRVVLDMDSTEIPVYGQQEQSAYKGHFESSCYHPLLLFNREGDCLAAKLRPGNVHSAEDWEELLLPEIERQQKLGKEVVFRADAAFAKPEIYEYLEEGYRPSESKQTRCCRPKSSISWLVRWGDGVRRNRSCSMTSSGTRPTAGIGAEGSRPRRSGRGCPATVLQTTRRGCSCLRWRTILGTSFGGSHCRRGWVSGR